MSESSDLRARAIALLDPEAQKKSRVFFAPGRVNLGGAHLDYNGGIALPVGISCGVFLAVAPRMDGILRMRSEHFPGETVEVPMGDLRPGRTNRWSAYLEGAVFQGRATWGGLPGLDVGITSNLPMGRGLSSSASLASAMVRAIAGIQGIEPLDLKECINLAYRAETEYVGVPCGTLDPSAVFLAKEDHIVELNCRNLDHQWLPFPSAQVRIAVMDSGIQRELVGSSFVDRVRETFVARDFFKQKLPQVEHLTDVSEEEFLHYQDEMDEIPMRRARHVISEFDRAKRGVEALRGGNLKIFGELMSQTHASLRDDYQGSTEELNVLAHGATSHSGCFGSRFVGAGFGGCVVALVQPDAVDDFEKEIPKLYCAGCGKTTEVSWFLPSAGAHELV
ncbi:MAG: galactokinase [Planctomycetes bacterium]|nr:galactokinase [Planctomycetota bacterium]